MSINLDNAIGSQIRAARIALGLTQSDVAREADVSRATVVALERSPGTARVHSLMAAARVCGLSVGTQHPDGDVLERRLARAQQREREERRYALHMRLAACLVLGNSAQALQDARQAVARWAVGRSCSSAYITAWDGLLQGSQQEVGERLASLSLPKDASLLQNTPFGSALGAYRPVAKAHAT